MNRRCVWFVAMMACLGVACDGSGTSQEDVLEQDTSRSDAVSGGDVSGDLGEGELGCERVAVSGDWVLEGTDSVSVLYTAPIAPGAEDGVYSKLWMLFERYSPGPDVGTFELGTGDDANFGNCPHCLYVGTPDVPLRVYFAEAGTLVLNNDPYSQRMDATVTGLRLREVVVDGATRMSRPIPDGRCIEVADFAIQKVFPSGGWTCEPELFRDGTECHCTCGAYDPDCAGAPSDCFPLDPNCPEPEELPIADCDAGQFCAFDPETFASICTSSCQWQSRTPCAQGTCVFDYGTNPGVDSCLESAERIDNVEVGEACKDSIYQLVCDIENGFALGYCGPNGFCRAVCEQDSDCTEPDHTCRRFLDPEGLGYCGPEPVDG